MLGLPDAPGGPPPRRLQELFFKLQTMSPQTRTAAAVLGKRCADSEARGEGFDRGAARVRV